MKYNQFLSSAFIVMICIPSVSLTFNQIGDIDVAKQEIQLSELPESEPVQEGLIERFQNTSQSFSENFGFRNQLIQLYNVWKVGLLNESSNPKVVLGKEGWLFLRDTLDHFDKQPLTEQELKNWVRVLEKQAAYVEEQGGKFLFVMTPTKASIYPEFLPDNWKSFSSSHAEQIVSYCKENSTVEIFDLRPILLANKSEGILYDKTDTHWNDHGASVAAAAIFDRLASSETSFEPLLTKQTSFRIEPHFSGDLSRLLMMEHTFIESAVRLELPAKQDWQLIETGERLENINGLSRPILRTENENRKLPRVIIFRDSFCDALLKYLAPQFSKATYIWRNHELDTEKIASEQPDFVIQQIAERLLVRSPSFQR